ncbi:hypothetical protein J6U78_00110 [bacterium]|nr:hypothetical protein [bacterium]
MKKAFNIFKVFLVTTMIGFAFTLLAEECSSNCSTSSDQLMKTQTSNVVLNCQSSGTNSVFLSEEERMKKIRRQRFVDGLSCLLFFPICGIEDGIINISHNTEHPFQVMNNLVLAIPMCTADYLICGTLKTMTLGHFWNDNLIFHITGMNCHFY